MYCYIKKVIVSAILQHWVSIFGSPGKFISDNGGEFNNELLRDPGEQLNTRVLTTAAESPWSNGIVERHNAVLGTMIKKIIEDTACTGEIALVWALSAKNALANNYGYSPNQLVFGKKTNYPCAMNDKLPAL